MKKTIVTFSRRTDGGLYIEWLIERLKEGFCEYPNPVSGKIIRQPLTRESIIFLSLWTKLPDRVVPYIKELIKFLPLNIQVTINCYGNSVEKNIPQGEILIDSFKRVSESIKNINLINWRYDPIILSKKFNINWHIDNFSFICERLKGWTNRVIVSPLQITGAYSSLFENVKNNRIKDNDRLIPLDKNTFFKIVEQFITIAKDNNIDLNICCEPVLDKERDISFFKKFSRFYKGCISEDLVKEFSPDIIVKKANGQRKNCLCCDCRDIGVYYTCSNGCVYCYANRKKSFYDIKFKNSS